MQIEFPLNENQVMVVESEKCPAVLAHAFLADVFFSEEQKAFVRDINMATRYVGAKARESGFEKVKELLLKEWKRLNP